MNFVSVDVETANPDLSSICRIGIVHFENGRVSKTWQQYVDPEDEFSVFNIAVHGVTPQDVRGAPKIPDLLPEIRTMVEGKIVVCHGPFDRVAFGRAAEKYNLPPLDCIWLDTMRVVRRAWSQFAQGGYGLSNIAQFLGISYTQHVPVEDARAAGEVLLRAIAETGLSLQEWLIRVEQPISPESKKAIVRDGNPDGPLAGEVLVFTGSLSIPRRVAADLAAEAGCTVAPGVTTRTTIVVVGDQDIRRLGGHTKSRKHRKAEELIEKGYPIRILTESDFFTLIGADATSLRSRAG